VCHPFDFFATHGDVRGLLERIDVDLARQCRDRGCWRCGARLDVANYPRRVRDMLIDAHCASKLNAVVDDVRFSFCCAACRKRTTPPSVRFPGRKHFHSTAFLIISAVSRRLTGEIAAELEELFAVSERTVRRWRRWWRTQFSASAFWRQQKARLRPPVPTDDELPLGLVERFAHTAGERMAAVLRFLAPVTTTTSCPDLRAG